MFACAGARKRVSSVSSCVSACVCVGCFVNSVPSPPTRARAVVSYRVDRVASRRRAAADERLSEEERRRSETDALREKLTRVERKNTEVHTIYYSMRSSCEGWVPLPSCPPPMFFASVCLWFCLFVAVVVLVLPHRPW